MKTRHSFKGHMISVRVFKREFGFAFAIRLILEFPANKLLNKLITANKLINKNKSRK